MYTWYTKVACFFLSLVANPDDPPGLSPLYKTSWYARVTESVIEYLKQFDKEGKEPAAISPKCRLAFQ